MRHRRRTDLRRFLLLGKISNGYITLSDAPGLGINITEKIKEKFPPIKGSGFRIKK